jgi:putative toxin-antitoxin system antitoxin component (TIGR02293 family)
MAIPVKELRTRLAIPNFNQGWIENSAQIFKTAKVGVNTNVFYDFADTIKMRNSSLAGILQLSPRTVSNYHQNKQALAPVQGEHLLKLIALYEKGVDLFGSIDEFNYWLNKPFWNSTEKPVDWLVTPGGVGLVTDELDRLGYGYPA